MKTILATIAIVLATITTASADIAEQLRFEAIKMEIQADELQTQIDNLESGARRRDAESAHFRAEARRLRKEFERRWEEGNAGGNWRDLPIEERSEIVDLETYANIEESNAKEKDAEARQLRIQAENIKATMQQLRQRATAYRRKADEQ